MANSVGCGVCSLRLARGRLAARLADPQVRVEEVSGGKFASVFAGEYLAEALLGLAFHCLLCTEVAAPALAVAAGVAAAAEEVEREPDLALESMMRASSICSGCRAPFTISEALSESSFVALAIRRTASMTDVSQIYREALLTRAPPLFPSFENFFWSSRGYRARWDPRLLASSR